MAKPPFWRPYTSIETLIGTLTFLRVRTIASLLGSARARQLHGKSGMAAAAPGQQQQQGRKIAGHSDSVLCCEVFPERKLLVSGGEVSPRGGRMRLDE